MLRGAVDFGGVQVVENRHFGEGCSSSIAAALGVVDPRAEVLVLMLGDQPGRDRRHGRARCWPGAETPRWRSAPTTTAAAIRWRLRRGMFQALSNLHGDKGVWKLLDRFADEAVDVAVAGPIPRDVDTWEDYEALIAS